MGRHKKENNDVEKSTVGVVESTGGPVDGAPQPVVSTDSNVLPSENVPKNPAGDRPDSNGGSQTSLDAKDISPLTADEPKPRRKRRSREEIEAEKAEQEAKEKAEAQAKVARELEAKRLVTQTMTKAMIDTCAVLIEKYLPPAFSDAEKKALTDAWAPVVALYAEDTVSPWFGALLVTSAVVGPRMMDKWGRKNDSQL